MKSTMHTPILLKSAASGILAAIAVARCLSGLTAAGETEPPREWTPALMMQVKRIGSVQVSPDGSAWPLPFARPCWTATRASM